MRHGPVNLDAIHDRVMRDIAIVQQTHIGRERSRACRVIKTKEVLSCVTERLAWIRYTRRPDRHTLAGICRRSLPITE